MKLLLLLAFSFNYQVVLSQVDTINYCHGLDIQVSYLKTYWKPHSGTFYYGGYGPQGGSIALDSLYSIKWPVGYEIAINWSFGPKDHLSNYGYGIGVSYSKTKYVINVYQSALKNLNGSMIRKRSTDNEFLSLNPFVSYRYMNLILISGIDLRYFILINNSIIYADDTKLNAKDKQSNRFKLLLFSSLAIRMNANLYINTDVRYQVNKGKTLQTSIGLQYFLRPQLKRKLHSPNRSVF